MDMQEGVFLAYGLQRRHAGPDGDGEANTVPKAPNKATQCQLEIVSQTGQATRNRRPEPRTSNAIANWIKTLYALLVTQRCKSACRSAQWLASSVLPFFPTSF